MEISITVSQPPLNQLLKLIFCVLTHQNPQTNIMHFATLALLVLAVVAAVSAGVYGPAVGLGYGAVVPGYELVLHSAVPSTDPHSSTVICRIWIWCWTRRLNNWTTSNFNLFVKIFFTFDTQAIIIMIKKLKF
ncbi:hypothetical protein Ocin01_02112 [Orchesella cincta]|uniref:Transmembrane protein n=1 Tax=Orchesella cincta TaxID=48709 RepID=A0A1D2NHS4_ORCCI|nr:hypothetical protein Ocin01_02112 [Orchesella cincta]